MSSFVPADKKQHIFRIDLSKHSFSSKSMRSNVADLVAPRVDDNLPADSIGSRLFWARRRALLISLQAPVFRDVSDAIRGEFFLV